MTHIPVRRISLEPSTQSDLRRYVRVLAMVGEIHKAGYQRIRVIPSKMRGTGVLKLYITHYENIDSIISIIRNSETACYSTSDGKNFFGWSDAADMSARQLASHFLDRYPEIAERGKGRDWAYAGWFLEIIGQAEQGDPVILQADWDLPGDYIELWRPPSPLTVRDTAQSDRLISYKDLTLSIVPLPEARWEEIEPFCLTFDGYADGRDIEVCSGIAREVLNGGLSSASMDELRTTLFIRQRRMKWNDAPADEEMADVRRVLSEIRRRLEALT
jgi:hypothetical protein